MHPWMYRAEVRVRLVVIGVKTDVHEALCGFTEVKGRLGSAGPVVGQ